MGKLYDTIASLNANLTDVATCKKAKKLRRILIWVGGFLILACSVVLVVCLINFLKVGFGVMNGMFNQSDNVGDTFSQILPYLIVFIICGLLLMLGIYMFKAGFKILVGTVGAKFVDKSLNTRCSNCGFVLTDQHDFCPKCGQNVRRVCPNCNHKNENGSDFCAKCGNPLKNSSSNDFSI